MGNEQSSGGPGRGNLPQGMQAMGSQLQRKFAKGCQYNMKVIIKGDRNTGKTCLLKRLQGEKFQESYVPTQEIQAASIHWNYRASDDVVKVEVWDVVDKGANAQRRRSESLKLQNEDATPDAADHSGPNLDAGFLDVYKRTNGVIMTMDICKAWTWKYVQRELEQVPPHVPIIVLGNFRDMGEHRVVEREEVEYYIRSLDRPEDAGEVRYAEVSMKNAFGLKYLHKFFNLPFLRLQRATLLAQLKTNRDDLATTLEELNFHLESEEQDYDSFQQGLETRRKEFADRVAQQKAAAETAGNGTGAASAGTAPQQPDSRKPSTGAVQRGTQPPPAAAVRPASTSVSTPVVPATTIASRTSTSLAPPPAVAATPVATTGTPTPPTSTTATSQSFGQRFASKLGWRKEGAAAKPAGDAAAQLAATHEARVRNAKPAVQENVEDFVPDGGLADDFLGDDAAAGAGVSAGVAYDDEDDSDDGRPAVAGFDDLDSDDDGAGAYTSHVADPGEETSDDDAPPPVIAADADDIDDEPSVAVVVVADDDNDDFDSDPSPPPVRKVMKPKQSSKKPVVIEDAVPVTFEVEPSPPRPKKASPSSPRAKPAPSRAEAKPKAAKKPVVVSSSSDSEDGGPVVAPLEGDSGDEIHVEKAIPVADDDVGPDLQPMAGAAGFMDHWLDGGAIPTTQFEEPAQPISAASLLSAEPLIPAANDAPEKAKKKKKKKSSDGPEASAADGTTEKKKKKKKAASSEGGEEVKKKPKKRKSRVENPDDA